MSQRSLQWYWEIPIEAEFSMVNEEGQDSQDGQHSQDGQEKTMTILTSLAIWPKREEENR
jgi:hypothetical protein